MTNLRNAAQPHIKDEDQQSDEPDGVRDNTKCFLNVEVRRKPGAECIALVKLPGREGSTQIQQNTEFFFVERFSPHPIRRAKKRKQEGSARDHHVALRFQEGGGRTPS